jgi:hypothetical protein
MEETHILSQQIQQIQNSPSIWDELVACSEPNVLETRENIIRYFASNTIVVEATHKIYDLTSIYLYSWCYNELYEHVFNSKQVNLQELFDKTKKNLKQTFKLEDIFVPNIYDWDDIRGFTGKIRPDTQLLLTPKVIRGIKKLDMDYERYVNKIYLVLDKYQTNKTIGQDQLQDIKNQFEDAFKLLPSKISIYSTLHDN